MNNKINLVSVATGSYDDYSEKTIFATKDKEKALKWVERFNNIVQDNTKRIMNFDCDDNKKEPFLFWYLSFEQPRARTIEVEVR